MKIATLVANVVLLTLLGSTIGSGQEQQRVPPKQPHLFHCWTDASGETHIKEIILGNNRRAPISGATVNFSGTPQGNGNGVPAFHRAPRRQFAITVFGEVDLEAPDGSKAHLKVGDMSFIEDTLGKGHKTTAGEGASSLFISVPDDFDVEAWAHGTN